MGKGDEGFAFFGSIGSSSRREYFDPEDHRHEGKSQISPDHGRGPAGVPNAPKRARKPAVARQKGHRRVMANNR